MKPLTAAPSTVTTSVLNVNRAALWLQSNGAITLSSVNERWSLRYPRGAAGLLYGQQVILAGKVHDGRNPTVRMIGGTYNVANKPGVILEKGIPEDPMSDDARTFRIRSDYMTADLRQDAAEVFLVPADSVTDQHITALRQHYERDWNAWPVFKGAPFVDSNGDGIKKDEGERPGHLEADQVVWFAYNDLDEQGYLWVSGEPPIGIETQVTAWGYKDVPLLQGVIFLRYRFIYKGLLTTPDDAVIDSMYFMLWSDPDVGHHADDLGGCDNALSLGFAYSATNPDQAYKPYGWQNPALGYLIAQGPIVAGAPDDAAYRSGERVAGFRNLPMTSFWMHGTGDVLSEMTVPYEQIPVGLFYWMLAQGIAADSWKSSTLARRWVDRNGRVTLFPYSGDPITRTGWIDGEGAMWCLGDPLCAGWSMPPGDRRMILSCGPFSMAQGDTQEVVVALIAAEGSDDPASTAVVKYYAKTLPALYPDLAEAARTMRRPATEKEGETPAKYALSQNYPNPFNPSTTIEYTLPFEMDVRLTIHDVLGREVSVLEDRKAGSGTYRVVWDGTGATGEFMPSGVYFLRMEAGHVQLVRKLLLLK